MSIRDALKFYYKISIIPLNLYIIFGIMFPSYSGPLGMIFPFYGKLGVWRVVIAAVLLLWIAEPAGIFINTALFHLFGKIILKRFRMGIEQTFTAVVYSVSAPVLFYWLSQIPILGIISILIGIWGYVILILGLSNLQKISWKAALGTVLLAVFVVAVIAIAVAFTAISLLGIL
jgi:hypothetical protein